MSVVVVPTGEILIDLIPDDGLLSNARIREIIDQFHAAPNGTVIVKNGSSLTYGSPTVSASSITDLAESVQDIVANLLTAGSNITLNYNDALGTLTISSTGGGGGPGGTVQYEQSFTNVSLTIAGLLIVTHNLDTYPSAVKVWSNVGDEIWPDNVSYSTSNVVVIDLSSFMPIVGTWTLSIGV